jgi:hypothetical protein
MSWFSDFTAKPIDQAHAAADDLLSKLSPIILQAEHRAMGMIHGILTRLNGTTFTITVSIPPQPYPDATSEVRKGEKV